MKRFTAFASILLLLGACTVTPPAPVAAPEPVTVAAPQPPPPPATPAWHAQLPPLLDRNLFFDDPKIAGAQISPDGKFISFRKPHNNVMNIWVKRTEEPFEAARPITADTKRPVRGYFWSEDGRYILYIQDKGGNENFHVYAVDPAAPNDPATGVPPARDLTPGDNVRAFIYAVPEATPNEILVGLNDRDPALHDVYRLNLKTGERKLLIRNDQNIAGYLPDLKGTIRLASRQSPDGGTEILQVTNNKLGKVILRCSFEETCQPARFQTNGKLAYMIENVGPDVDLARLSLFDPSTGKITPIESDPEKEVDLTNVLVSDKTEELVATVYTGNRERIYPRDPEFKRLLDDLRADLPDGEIGFMSGTNDDSKLIVSVASDVDPGSVYLYDVASGNPTLLYRSRPELPSQHLAPMKGVRYPSRDGGSIPAFLTVPKGVDPRNLPAIIVPHGGPWARDFWGYNSMHQFLANRGYVVLSPNFRASTGYGKKFLNAGNKAWGTGLMQHDLSDGVKYLIDNGIADPKKIGIMGGSYGGYATLAGLTFTPELYAAGVSIVGPSNLFTLLNSIPAYWGPVKKIFLLRMGDPDVPADKTMLEAQSPLFHASRIEDPLLVIQGANDPRVKQAESDQIVVAMRDLGRPVEYVVAPDEGHGFAGRENRIAMFAAIEKFLAKHLGGRYQESMPDDIATKLTAITVDPAKVEKPKIATALDAAKTNPLPVVDASVVAPGTLNYTTTLNLSGGRSMKIDGKRVVARETSGGNAVYRVTSTATTPMGEASDVIVVDATSLRPVSRLAKQGPATVQIAYGDKAVTGEINAGAQKMPINVALEAPVFGDEAALELAVSAMPLAPGFRTTIRTVEAGMQQRVRFWSVAVSEDSVTVPAGTFQTYKVVLEPLDNEGGGTTYWVTKDSPRYIVRGESKLPAMMGGGTAVSELTGRAK
ncbi:MAG TPA: prolyl oligopeptidase family serine peptidase [Thermoanaerobaculia bacterium]|nr:prolyl oligopeptidase family serine peptidase [Thermoanaerobaculia bacterium]